MAGAVAAHWLRPITRARRVNEATIRRQAAIAAQRGAFPCDDIDDQLRVRWEAEALHRWGLSAAQATVLLLALTGRTRGQDASEALGISFQTVKNHRTELFKRMGVPGIDAAVVRAWHAYAPLRRGGGAANTDTEGSMRGTDVASFQTGMEYAAAKAAGIDFVIVKVSDGSTYVNPLFHQQVNNAYAAGQLLGYYHFWRQAAGDKQQAARFWEQIRAVWERGERVAIDVEQPDDDPTPLPADTGERIYAMAVELERLSGVTPDLYMDRSTQQRFFTDPKFARFGLWLAAWQAQRPPAPAPWDRITIWQTSGGAVLPGIGWADTDQFDGTAVDWASSTIAPVQPQTPASGIDPGFPGIVQADQSLIINGQVIPDGQAVVAERLIVQFRNAQGTRYHIEWDAHRWEPWQVGPIPLP